MAEKATIARPYAQALFSYAKGKGGLEAVSKKVHTLAAVTSLPEVNNLIGNPKVSPDQLLDLILEGCGGKKDPFVENLVRTLVMNNRLILAPEIVELFEQYRRESEKKVEATVTSAFPVTSEQEKKIASALNKRLGKKVTITTEVDKSLVGGAVIRAGDLVVDGSVTGHMGRLSSVLSK